MRTYVEKRFGKDFIKKVDIQELGIYYSIPIKDIYEEKREEFDYEDLENDRVSLDKFNVDNGNYIENYNNVCYDYTDENEIDSVINDLMNYNKYEHYLVVLFNSTWNNSSGYKIFNKYDECFYRDYDVSMYVVGSSRSGKYLKLQEYHHDKPLGHSSIVVGLTESEYQKLDNKNIQDIINYGTKCLDKIIEI